MTDPHHRFARPSRVASTARARVFVACACASLAVGAAAQSTVPPGPGTTSEIATRSQWQVVMDRLEGPALFFVVGALLVVALLVWRIVASVRRERPVRRRATATARARSPERNDTMIPTAAGDVTDWGHDENKRSAAARVRPGAAPLAGNTVTGARPTTQWPPLERASVLRDKVAGPDTLGAPLTGNTSPYRTGFNPYFHGEPPEQRIVVEEVADTLTQAELLVQLGDPKEAMNLLSRHIRETEQPGPEVWLMLLDLYQSTGRESQYNALAEGFHALFNAQVPPWPASRDAATRDLETYVQVMRALYGSWPKPSTRTYLTELLTDNRGGSRQGFSLGAYRELLFLVELLDTLELMAREEQEAPRFER